MRITFPVALLAGVLSFASPCFLPVVPVFVGQLVGTGEGRLNQRDALVNTTSFVAGFSAVFMAVWASLGLVGRSLGPYVLHARVLGGAVLVLMGLHVAGILSVSLFDRVVRGRGPRLSGHASPWQALLLGTVFAAGWTPCVGPVLGGVLALATTSSTVWSGVLLMGAYCLGLGLPLIAVASGAVEVTRHFSWFRRHHVAVSLVSGGLLVLVGFLMIANLLQALTGMVPRLGV